MNRSRNRKIGYLLTIVVLFTLMIWVGRHLGNEQERLQIAQKSLGKVNPVSGTAQLVLGGFRGVAVTLLWNQVQEMQLKGQYFEIEPLVESITLLQPHFRRPWEFQAWNIAFNIAADWEAVKDKYYWVQRGIEFMKRATDTNRNSADLEWYVGYMYFTRFGQSDEKTYFRQLFRESDDLEFVQAENGVKDNFLKARDWFVRANDICIKANKPPQRMSPHPFMCRPALSRSFYADFLAQEGTFGTPTSEAWRQAYREWVDFGLLGGTDRRQDFIYRLEYTPSEREKLTEEQKFWRNRYQDVVRYDFWKIRCQTEADPELQKAREAIYKANDARKNGAYAKAITFYEEGLPLWRKIMEQNETYREDMLYKEDCQEMEDDYLRLLAHVGKPTPARRPFDGIVPPMRDSLYNMMQEEAKAYREQHPLDGQTPGEPPKAPSVPFDSGEPAKAPSSPQ